MPSLIQWVRIDLPSSLRAMEPAIIVISSDEEDMDPGPLGPPPHLDVAALHLWWQVLNAASRLHETPSINCRRRRRLLVAFLVHNSPGMNFLVEKRFMKRMARRTKPAEPGCPVRRRNLLPVLNWHKSRKEVNRELHAMNGNTSSSVAPSHARNVRPRVDSANDDDLNLSLAPTIVVPPTMPRGADLSLSLDPNAQPYPVLADDDGTGALFEDPAVHTPPLDRPAGSQPAHTHTALEDRLERLFAQGRDLASSLVRPEENIDEMGIVAATETLKRYILTSVPAWQNRPIMLQVALGALQCFTYVLPD